MVDVNPGNLGTDLVVVVGQLTRRLGRESRNADGVSVWRALAVIDQYEPVTIGGIARAYGSSQPGATKLVARLEAEGLAQRSQVEGDARVSKISLTQAGKDRLSQERQVAADYLSPLMDNLSQADQQAVARTVEILGQFMDSRPGMPEVKS